MPAYEVSRTLVKSPPEVWSELEQAERLAELLGDGAIKITRREPETRIEWQGADANGTIEIGASGWGTKVRLTAETTEEPVAATTAAAVETPTEPAAAEPDSAVAAKPDSAAESGMPKPDPTDEKILDPCVELKTAAKPDSAAADSAVGLELGESDGDLEDEAETVAKISFWRRIRNVFSAQSAAAADEADQPTIEEREDTDSSDDDPNDGADFELSASHDDESVASTPVEPIAEDSPLAEQASEASEPEVSAPPETYFESLLTSVLDHLGSAHKRPFSAV
jgi:hypothetical protein